MPVRREEARVEREPITEANVDDALEGPDMAESEHEVTLQEEKLVTDKKTVHKEGPRREGDRDEEQPVKEQVRKERIETNTEPTR